MKVYQIALTVLLLSYVSAAPNQKSLEDADSSEETSGSDQHEENTQTHVSVIGGHKVPIQDYPYTAAVIEKTEHFGSAIVLNKKWLLTSAWVLKFEDTQTMLIRTGSSSAIDKGQTIWVDTTILHPDYTQTWANDVGLIKLKKPLKFDKYTKAIKIAAKPPTNGKSAALSGFGLVRSQKKINSTKKYNDNIHDGWLRAASLSVMSNKVCKDYYNVSRMFTDTNYCTKPSTTVGPCAYDYGSPLVIKKELVGLFSGVPVCTDERYPPVFTEVSRFTTWIQETIRKNSEASEYEELYSNIEYY